MEFTIEEVTRATNATVLKCSDLKQKVSISTDTRTIKSGDIYLPLKGENFDGEKFLEHAIKSGAEGCFITQNKYPKSAKTVLKIPDTKEAYLQIASYARKKFNPKTILITGSSGKTTTKEMVYSVCSAKFKTHKTFSNHNNEIGFCQTVLSMDENCEVLILEVGMRGFSEIELVSKYSNPDYAIITNVGSAHIGRLGSLDNIAKAKCEITTSLNKNGALISNESERIRKFAHFNGEKIFYTFNEVKIIKKLPKYTKFSYKNQEFELNVEGDYNVENSLAAIEIGNKLNMTYEEIRQGLINYKPIEKRWEIEEIEGYKIINDSYNANPESMKASVSTFLELYKKPVVVLGNMGELGEKEEELHKEVGKYLSTQNVKNATILTVGKLADEIGKELETSAYKVKNFKNNNEISLYILENIKNDTTIFLKASRSMKFEEIIENIRRAKKV